MSLLDRILTFGSAPKVAPWVLVAVGNPGLDNLETRRALGRLLLVRWGLRYQGDSLRHEDSEDGALYFPYPDLHVFLPEVTSAGLGTAVKGLVDRGQPLTRVVLVASDGRLPFGKGRLRVSGEMDHPGVQQVGLILQPRPIARLVFGIGPLGGPGGASRDDRWMDADMERVPGLVDRLACFIALLRETESLATLVPRVNAPIFWEG